LEVAVSELTFEKIREMMRCLPPGPRNDLFDPFPMRPFMGMPVYDAPPPQPKIEVRDIKFSDGTSILPAAFRAEMNRQLLERFGVKEDLFRDHVYVMGNRALVASPMNAHLLRNLGP
jgi:hypothetical protein